jgi:TonB family protein
MKSKVVFLFLMILSTYTFGQDLKVDVEEVRVTPPIFVGIEKAVPKVESHGKLESYILKEIQYPPKAIDWLKEGTEVVQFVVTPEGKLEDFKIINSLSYDIDNEVIRALKTTDGLWKPGFNNDKPVAMEHEISVVFKIGDEGVALTDFKKMGQLYFQKGGNLLLIKDKPKRALKNYDQGIVMLPNDKSLLLMRGLARYETGDKDGAMRDWKRIKALGGDQGDFFLDGLQQMKGYAELIQIFNK